MPTITVKNIPADLYEHLKHSARAHHRSINGEVISCIERSVGARKIDAEATIARARTLRRRTAEHPIGDNAFTQAKEAGRP